MASKETAISNRCMVRASKRGARLWRNNVGLFLSLDGRRKVKCGLCKGSADLIGIRPTVITPEMVGQTVGVFWSVENKIKTGKAREEQLNWQQVIRSLGGIAEIVRHEDEL